MITQILQIKQLKAERAEYALQKQQHTLTQANARVNQACQAVIDYKNWRQTEEHQLLLKPKSLA